MGAQTNFPTGMPFACLNPAVSADGRYVAFLAASRPLYLQPGQGHLFRRDQQLGVTELLHLNVQTQYWPQISIDGRFVAYGTTNGLYVWDGQRASNTLVQANTVAPAVQRCGDFNLAPDGSRLSFILVSNDVTFAQGCDLGSGVCRPVNVLADGTLTTVNDALAPLFFPDGQRVLMESSDARLVSDDHNRATDVFEVSLETGSVELVSARANGRPDFSEPVPAGILPASLSSDGNLALCQTFYSGPEPDPPGRPARVAVKNLETGSMTILGDAADVVRDAVLSADGRFVAFARSSAGPLFGEFSRDGEMIERLDLRTGARATVATGAYRASIAIAGIPPLTISPDGNLVGFQSVMDASRLASQSFVDTNSGPDVFLRDMSTGETRVMSLVPSGAATGNGESTEPFLTPDARWLLFRSKATNLVTNGLAGLLARDLQTGTTLVVDQSFAPTTNGVTLAVSANSRFVASARTGVDSPLQVFDLFQGSSTQACTQCRGPSLTADGRWLAFEQTAPGDSASQVRVVDLVNGTVELISVSTNGFLPGNGASFAATISPDGRFVVFASRATDLVQGDDNMEADVFVRDRLRHLTLLLSVNRTGSGPGNNRSTRPVFGADGRTVLFQSFARDLVDGADNAFGNVFVLRLGGRDGDGDGMDDDWELAYFNSLDRDGTGDFDGDGATDLSEFMAGTDPTNQNSVLQVFGVGGIPGGDAGVMWTAVPGRSYRVQTKESVTDPDWIDASDRISAAGSTAVWIDHAGPFVHRFYRVRLVR